MIREMWFPVEGKRDWQSPIVDGTVIAIDYPGFRHKPWRIHEIKLRDDNTRWDVSRYAPVYALPEHYVVCHKCGEIPPCSEVWAEQISKAEIEQSARFEVAGIFPACQEPVTHRQKAHRFPENTRVPLGPPVTFHARRKCRSSAIAYDMEVAKSTGRGPLLSCTGLLVHHLDDHMECTNITCPGVNVQHREYARCYLLNERCNRPECWAVEATRISQSRTA